MIRLRLLLKGLLGAGLVAAMGLVAGFFVFCATLPRAGGGADGLLADQPGTARGLIILTGGGGERIAQGLTLVEQGLAERALISGVHPRTTKEDLAGMGPASVLRCCVDLGPMARTTRGNAMESRAWLVAHDYDVAVLVTSDFHLPRAAAELRHVAPQIEVIPVPVASVFAPEKGWMASPSSWRLLASEYLKYLFVRVRFLF